MSTEPAPGAEPRSLARAFPRPGRLVDHAYWELNIAANGTPEQVKALGDLRRLPRPWDPPTCTHPDLRLEVWVWLDEVVTWINHEHIWDTEGFIPSCWPEHPHLVHDLAVLADQRRRAGMGNTSDALEDWHRYALPAFLDRVKDRLKSHCENGHQTWPSASRHARHTSDPHRRRRVAVYKADVLQGQLTFDDGVPIGGSSPALTVLDGDVVDHTTGEVLSPRTPWVH